MKYRFLTTIVYLLLSVTLNSQNIQPPPAAGDPQKNAAAIVREFTLELDLNSPADMEARFHRVVTVLDKKAVEWSRVVLPYDKFNTVRDLSVTIYGRFGELVKKYGKKDFQDLSFLDDVTMAADSRYLFLNLSGLSLPCTIELDYTVRSKTALFCPDFEPQPEFNTAVEHARCTVRVPFESNLMYKPERAVEPVMATAGKFKTYTWEFQNLPAVPDEPDNLPLNQLTPVVRLNPGAFEIDGYRGDFKSWDGLAAWNDEMLNSLPPLAAPIADEMVRLTKDLSELDKIRAVYAYLQNNTRYISIQLGIGGWRPFDPNFVHSHKYGDCKALSWYTCSLLKAAGIKAYYTLVSAGDNPHPVDPDFPDQAFNHVIVTVPTAAGDTLFLECTSQTCPFGYVGSFTGNRRVLLIDGARGRILETESLPAAENIRMDSVRVRLTGQSSGAGIDWTAQFRGMGIESDGFYGAALHSDPQEQQKWAEKYFSLKGGRLENHTLGMDALRTMHPSGSAHAVLSSENLMSITPKRLYFQPNFCQPWKTAPSADSARVSPVFRRYGMTYVADIQLETGQDWTPESLPESTEVDTPFGVYRRSVVLTDGVFHYRRTIVLYPGTFPPEQYIEMVSFFKKMKKLDAEAAVFIH